MSMLGTLPRIGIPRRDGLPLPQAVGLPVLRRVACAAQLPQLQTFAWRLIRRGARAARRHGLGADTSATQGVSVR